MSLIITSLIQEKKTFRIKSWVKFKISNSKNIYTNIKKTQKNERACGVAGGERGEFGYEELARERLSLRSATGLVLQHVSRAQCVGEPA